MLRSISPQRRRGTERNGEPSSARRDRRGRLSLRGLNSESSYRRGFALQLLGLVVRNQAVDDRLQLAVHDLGELMDGEADAVVGDTVLREVVGADFFAAIAGPDHRFALFRESFLLLLHLDFVEAGAQDAHTFLAILDLGFFVLAV